MKYNSILAIIFAFIIALFSIQNSEVTDVKFLIWKLSMSRVLIILGSFGIGILVGILVSTKRRFKTN